MTWRVPELLAQAASSDDIYFDAISRVRLDSWSRGRVALVGDAADCVSLLGEGSSLAIAGAATLAESVATQTAGVGAGLRRYEQLHRRRVRPHHRGASAVGHLPVPATHAGVAVRNAAFHAGVLAATAHNRLQAAMSRSG